MTTSSEAGDNSPRFFIKGQYIKDISFENPHAPHSLVALDTKPRVDVNVDLKAQRFNDEHFELVLHISVRAKGKDGTLFLSELDYGAIVQFVNTPEEKIEPLLMVECAFVLFPFARRVIADVTRDGGFPPVVLEPIDFHALYLQTRKK